MKILITGGSGFVGTHVTRRLLDKGHEVTILARRPGRSPVQSDKLREIAADCMKTGAWQDAAPEHNVVINLAGVDIFKRWTESVKRLIRDSRLLTTRNLVDAIPEDASNMTLLSASAVGCYGPRGDEKLNEESSPGNDFLATLAVEWEEEALKAQSKGARVVIHRFGVVLGPDGGALPEMARPFRFFVGGPIGSGRQWFSWIHIDDLCSAAEYVLDNAEMTGRFNFTAPNPVQNKDLSRAIGKALHRPAFIGAPGFMIKLVMGEFGSVILTGQRVLPERLLESGFSFRFPEIQAAVDDCLK